jgi:dTDP-4-dehydrorhamnose 3,5-epimerase-like enzyme
MDNLPQVFKGNSFKDHRGELLFNNNFDLTSIKRQYQIISPDSCIRAWQGHQKEQKWLHVFSGSFEIKLIHFDFKLKSVLEKFEYIISENENIVLYVPGNYLNGFKALATNSKLIVYSNFDVESSKSDDYRFTLEDIPW